MKVLIVEDDQATAETVRSGLRSGSYTVELATDGADGSFMGRSFEYDAIVLDYSLPKKNGLAVCREIRAAGRATPILFLSQNDDTDLKIQALESGADDYVTKPFSIGELDARLRAMARRPQGLAKDTVLTVHDLSLNAKRNIVMRGSRRLRLTRKEFSLLEFLMANAGTVISRSRIMEHVWTADSNPFSNTVEAHMRNLRKKLNTGGKPDLIVNIPGRGYIIDTPQKLAKL